MNQYLAEKAIRVCVSAEVENAILGTDRVNGPTFVIPNGIDIPDIEVDKNTDVFIAGMKRPHLAEKIRVVLQNSKINVDSIIARVPRAEFLRRLASARVAIMLPMETEGFYLPAIEAMHLADLVVVPDCIGNRSFCIDRQEASGNCFFTSQGIESILSASRAALAMLDDAQELKRVKTNAILTVERHSLAREREAFYEVMDQVEALWNTF